MRLRVRSLLLLSGLTIWRRRHGSDPALLWLWHRLAATAPIRPLAWESPYAAEAALEKAKRKKKKKKRKLVTGFYVWCMCMYYPVTSFLTADLDKLE